MLKNISQSRVNGHSVFVQNLVLVMDMVIPKNYRSLETSVQVVWALFDPVAGTALANLPLGCVQSFANGFKAVTRAFLDSHEDIAPEDKT